MKKLLTIVFLNIALISFAQSSEVFSTKDGAIQGYDPVAYFKEGKPVKGKTQFTQNWNGATWHFASKENKEAFSANPEKYAPQFGGYCAYGTSQGHKSPTEPAAFTIVDNKLYLNYNLAVKSKWNENQKELIEKANTNWPSLRKQ